MRFWSRLGREKARIGRDPAKMLRQCGGEKVAVADWGAAGAVLQDTLVPRRQGRPIPLPTPVTTMTHHDKKHDHHGHKQQHRGGAKSKAIHKNWMTWVVLGLMLIAMLMYVLSDDERLQPGGEAGPEMPAAAE